MRPQTCGWDGSAVVYDVSNKVSRVDFGFINLNHHPVLHEPFLPNVETDGGRQNDTAEDTVLPLLPVSGDICGVILEGSNHLRQGR